jgi:hypothetical protein
MNRLLATFMICALAAGCATSNSGRGAAEGSKVDASKARVYGRFEMDTQGKKYIGIVLYNFPSIGLRFACERGDSFTVSLSAKQPDQVIEVPADKCSLKELVFSNGALALVAQSKPYQGSALQNVTFEAGKLHYLGDYKGSTWDSGGYRKWQLTEVASRFDETTVRMMADNPSLSALARIDLGIDKESLLKLQ